MLGTGHSTHWLCAALRQSWKQARNRKPYQTLQSSRGPVVKDRRGRACKRELTASHSLPNFLSYQGEVALLLIPFCGSLRAELEICQCTTTTLPSQRSLSAPSRTSACPTNALGKAEWLLAGSLRVGHSGLTAAMSLVHSVSLNGHAPLCLHARCRESRPIR